jgi:hypothetical protein
MQNAAASTQRVNTLAAMVAYSTAASTVVVTSFTAPRAVFAHPESSSAHKRIAAKDARRESFM